MVSRSQSSQLTGRVRIYLLQEGRQEAKSPIPLIKTRFVISTNTNDITDLTRNPSGNPLSPLVSERRREERDLLPHHVYHPSSQQRDVSSRC